ncbi:hypothetical protein [Actinoplanes sp. M2I2]|uniref:hypothetical protein n=1 Tax=Actinoplanes sp. M2I2 TaxID=1734444 RepID=UPI0020216F92|nr:hypothetical protein [Actinoplanes sp. M2I2]
MTAEEQDLLDRLGEVDVPVSRLTVASVTATATRRAARRRAAQAGCAAALVVGALVAVPALWPGRGAPAVLPGASGLPERCAAGRLPAPAGKTNVWAAAVDPTGRHIAGYVINGEWGTDPVSGKRSGIPASEPVVWTDGQPKALPKPVKAVQPTGINADGVMVAVAGQGKIFDSVFRYVDGVPAKAVLPAGSWEVHPYARINAKGDVLISAVPAGARDTKGVVFLWKAGSATATRLPLPTGANAKVLTDDGAILYDVLSADGQTFTSYVRDESGKGRALPGPAGQSGSVNTGRGNWAAGNAWPSGTAITWNLRTGEVTDTGLHAPAHGINGSGWILIDDTLVRDGRTVKLAVVEEGTARSAPRDVADNGTVVGVLAGSTDSKPDLASSGPLIWRCGTI